MLISEMKSLPQGKVKVCFEGGTDLTLYKKEVNMLKLAAGQDVTDELYCGIEEEILIPRAKKRALHLLEQQDRTEKGLADKLKESGYSSNVVDTAIAYVKSFHYLDDARYAKNYVQLHYQDKSRQRIMQDLKMRGIREEQITLALEEEYLSDESEQIAALIRKKGFDPTTKDQKEKAKMYRFLASRGFPANKIMQALNEFQP